MSIYRKIQNAKNNPDTIRTGCYWYPEEDQKLLENVLADKPLAQIALELKRTCGGVELRIRTLAYNEYVRLSSESGGSILVENIAKKYKIDYDDFSMFVRDKDKYRLIKEKEIEEKELLKKQAKDLKEKELQKIREEKEEKKLKEKELKIAQEEEKRKEKQALEDEKKKIKEEEKRKEKEAKEIREEEKKREKEILDEIKDEEHNYIYCIREREFLRSGDDIFKVGKTTVHPFKRMKQYPNGSSIVLILKVFNCHIAEQELLKYLDKKFETAIVNNQRIGREYYKASEENIIQAIFDCLIGTNSS